MKRRLRELYLGFTLRLLGRLNPLGCYTLQGGGVPIPPPLNVQPGN